MEARVLRDTVSWKGFVLEGFAIGGSEMEVRVLRDTASCLGFVLEGLAIGGSVVELMEVRVLCGTASWKGFVVEGLDKKTKDFEIELNKKRFVIESVE